MCIILGKIAFGFPKIDDDNRTSSRRRKIWSLFFSISYKSCYDVMFLLCYDNKHTKLDYIYDLD